VLNLKGGTGKTTTAVYLAGGLARTGRTLLIDADPQRSALSWSEAAGGFAFPVISLPVRDLATRVGSLGEGYAHIVIDTPPGDAALVRSAALAADLVIVTLPTGLIDIDRLSPTLELLAEVEASNPIRIRILLTRVRTGTRSAQAARELLAELGQPVLKHEIPLREAYTSGFGLAPTDLRHYQPVVDELLARAAAA
jgi:chromosome partitioning protein